jgi:hypothetical protein
MKALVLSLLLLMSVPAFAGHGAYLDGTFVNFKTIRSGRSCSGTGNTTGNINASTYDNGSSADTTGTVNATTYTSSSCADTSSAIYAVLVGDHIYTLRPYVSPTKVLSVMASMGTAAFFYKNSALYGQLPGTAIKVRSDGNGAFYIKVGKRESRYKLVGAE